MNHLYELVMTFSKKYHFYYNIFYFFCSNSDLNLSFSIRFVRIQMEIPDSSELHNSRVKLEEEISSDLAFLPFWLIFVRLLFLLLGKQRIRLRPVREKHLVREIQVSHTAFAVWEMENVICGPLTERQRGWWEINPVPYFHSDRWLKYNICCESQGDTDTHTPHHKLNAF